MNALFRYVKLYQEHLPLMQTLENVPNTPLIRECLWVLKQAYKNTPPEVSPGGGMLLKEFCGPGRIVYGIPGEFAFLGFRGIPSADVTTIQRCLLVLHEDFQEEEETLRVAQAVQSLCPNITVTGHSFGGARACFVSRNLQPYPPAILFNPAQGFDPQYPERVGMYPQIETYHIVGDIVSCIAGLENPPGIHRIHLPGFNIHSLDAFERGVVRE
jgi:hypothetical protein